MTSMNVAREQTQPPPFETLGSIWAQLHADMPFAISSSEAHYLRMLAMSLDDDIASLLLLKKLKLARELDPSALPSDLVVMNSFLEFTFGDGDRRFCQLAHSSSSERNFWLGINSRLGAGLIGLRAGQTVLWPDEQDRLRDLHVARVENSPRTAGGEDSGPGRSCAVTERNQMRIR